MSIPRQTDVARHLARRPRAASLIKPEIVRLKDAARTDLQVLTQDLAAAVDSAHNPSLSGVIQ